LSTLWQGKQAAIASPAEISALWDIESSMAARNTKNRPSLSPK